MVIEVKGKRIGENEPAFIVAEMSANHLQKYENAVEIIRQAKKAGADAIKLQTYTPDTITLDCDNEYFQIKQGTIWDGRTLYDLYKEAYTPWDWFPKLLKVAEEEGLIFFSAAFDPSAVDFLENLNVPFHKVASFEITDIPLIEYMASKGKPVIISTGVAELADIELAVNTCRNAGNDKIILLKCTSAYPAPVEEANLRHIPLLKNTFGTLAGLSDHTMGIISPIVAVALGADMIEKHFTFDRTMGGVDSKFSLEPAEFSDMVKAVRDAEKASGKKYFMINEEIRQKGKHFSRSLFTTKEITKGDLFSSSNVRSIRPGNGLHPKYIKEILGKRALNDIKKGTPLKWNFLDQEEKC